MNKKITITCILVITFGLISCKNSHPNLVNNNFNFVDTSIAVINDTAETKYYTKDRPLWNPTQIEIFIIDSIMRETTKDTLLLGRILDFNKYYKQYVCYIDSSGDSIIYINGFCKIPEFIVSDSTGLVRFIPRDWKKTIFIIEDGGSCYWRMKIN